MSIVSVSLREVQKNLSAGWSIPGRAVSKNEVALGYLAEMPDFKANIHDFGASGEIIVQAVRPMSEYQNLKWALNPNHRMRPKRDDSDESEEQELSDEEILQRQQKDAENKARSVRRSKKQIRHAVKTLEADHLVTLSYRENMQDVDRLKRDWKRFVRLVREKEPEFQYVAVREKQDRGAYHLHIAVKGRQNINLLRRCWYVALGASPYAKGADTPGQIDVRGPSKRWGSKTLDWKIDKLAGYMTKYIHKEFEDLEERSKRYWHSDGVAVEKPERVWLAEAGMLDCIKWAHGELSKRGFKSFTMWLSESGDTFWISGAG